MLIKQYEHLGIKTKNEKPTAIHIISYIFYFTSFALKISAKTVKKCVFITSIRKIL